MICISHDIFMYNDFHKLKQKQKKIFLFGRRKKMKKQNKMYICLFILGFSMIQSSILNDVSATYESIMMTRENTVYILQNRMNIDNYNPFIWNVHYGSSLMYESLFGQDRSNDQLILAIGTAMTWSEDNSFITVNLNPSAEWSDGQPITADDVIFSYQIAANQSYYPDMSVRIQSIEKIDNYNVRFRMNPGYYHSIRMEEWLSSDIPILPKHVWSEINATYADENGSIEPFQNSWFDPSFPEEWKVSSGPYTPYQIDGNSRIFKLRDNWWGYGLIYTDLPNFEIIPQAQYVHFTSAEEQPQTPDILNNVYDFIYGDGNSDNGDILDQNNNLITFN